MSWLEDPRLALTVWEPSDPQGAFEAIRSGTRRRGGARSLRTLPGVGSKLSVWQQRRDSRWRPRPS